MYLFEKVWCALHNKPFPEGGPAVGCNYKDIFGDY